MSGGIAFTPEMTERVRLERSKAQPTPWAQLAGILGVATGTVLNWAYQNGVETDPRNLPSQASADPAKSEALKVLWSDPTIGKEEIARRLGVGRKSLPREAARLGLEPRAAVRCGPKPKPKPAPKPREPRKDAWPQTKLDELRELVASGLPYAEIGLRLKISKCAAIGMARRMGLAKRPSPIQPRQAPKRKRSQGNGVLIGRTLPGLALPNWGMTRPKPQPTPAVTTIRPKHPGGCQWHMGREGLTHLFCAEPIGPRGGSWCEVHYGICFVPTRAREIADAA